MKINSPVLKIVTTCTKKRTKKPEHLFREIMTASILDYIAFFTRTRLLGQSYSGHEKSSSEFCFCAAAKELPFSPILGTIRYALFSYSIVIRSCLTSFERFIQTPVSLRHITPQPNHSKDFGLKWGTHYPRELVYVKEVLKKSVTTTLLKFGRFKREHTFLKP